MRTVRLLVAAFALGTLAVPPLAEAKTRPPTVRFSAPFVDRATLPYGLYQCGITQTGVCDVKFDGHAWFTGSLETFVDYFGYGHVDPATRVFVGESWDHHSGSLKGCGSGSFVMHQHVLRADFNTYSPVSGTYRVDIEWRVLPGSGTGDFADATGSGTAEADSTLQGANTGIYTGVITCPRGRARG